MQTILVVDDDAHIRELLRFYLQRDGYYVVQAEDGQEALEVLLETDIHLAIVDIMMPKVDGYALCKEIRQDYDIQGTKDSLSLFHLPSSFLFLNNNHNLLINEVSKEP